MLLPNTLQCIFYPSLSILILSSTFIKSLAVIYNIALAGSTGVARRNLEAIGELYFNSQNVATQIVFNLSAMSVFFF